MDIDLYYKKKQIDLARSIAARKKIYLDLNYWIWLRDAARGLNVSPTIHRLLDVLRTGVAEGKIICPISLTVFLELLKQNDPASRMATADLIDELALGVALIADDERIFAEIVKFFQGQSGLWAEGMVPVQDLIWTKVGYAFGTRRPSMDGVPAQVQYRLLTAFVDEYWRMSTREFVEGMTATGVKPPSVTGIAADITRDSAAHAHQIKSFQQAYDTEIKGSIEPLGDMAVRAFITVASAAAGEGGTIDKAEWRRLTNVTRNMMLAYVRKPAGKKALRSLHIGACLHAHFRWNKGQTFKPNDFHDYMHAVAAVGYCDAFFTEGNLADLINRNNTALTKINGCQATADIDEAIKIAELFLEGALVA